MKKTYTKPMIMFESFSLSTNIAGDCEIKIDTLAEGKCAYSYVEEFTEVNLFTDVVSACLDKKVDSDYNGFCYHVPIDTNNLFNS